MQTDKVKFAVSEAKRFLDKAEAALKARQNRILGPDSVTYTKEAAACKRASMDLTRALAEMRKP